MPLFAFLGVIIAQRLLELRLAERNRRAALAKGAREYGRGHYPLFFLLHAGWLFGLAVEGRRVNGGRPPRGWQAPFAVWLGAQGLRYWAIASLRGQWNTRILIIPGAERVRRGPYRWFSHPNYAAVALELPAAALTFGAWRTAVLSSLLNALVLGLVRLPDEERALRAYARFPERPAN